MKSSNYVVIQGWMCNELNLKGNELLVFALIYGFCQDGESTFSGSRSYIAETFNISLPTVDKALDALKDKELLEVNKSSNNYCTYKVSLQVLVKFLYKPCKVSLPNNIDNNQTNKNVLLSKDNNTQFEFGKRPTKKATLWDKCVNMIDAFTGNSDIRRGLIECLKLFIQNSKEADRPFYSNNFKGKLNNLAKLSYNSEEQLKIIRQTLDRGYNDFYEVTEGKSTKRNAITDIEHLDSSKMSHATDKEKQELKEAIRNGTAEKF